MIDFIQKHWLALGVVFVIHTVVFLVFFVFSEPLLDVELSVKKGQQESIVEAYSFDQSVYQKEVARLDAFEKKQANQKRLTEKQYQKKLQALNNQQLNTKKLYQKLQQKVRSQEKTLAEQKSKIVAAQKKQQSQQAALKKQQQLLVDKKKALKTQAQKQKSLEHTLKEKERLIVKKQNLIQQKDQLIEQKKSEQSQLAKKIKDEQVALQAKLSQQQAIEKNLQTRQRLLEAQQSLYENIQKLTANEREKQLKAAQMNYILMISNQVRSRWRQPINTRPNWYCDLLVTQNDQGIVLNIEVQKCNNNDTTFIQSVERAVWAASPLPLPKIKDIFDNQILFSFKAREY